ncbi:MAG: DNA-protecting protein DprA, partial [Opitutae bacterium]|nr:DNA-protecting protein DprA [Opitutae bacterium]
AVPGRIDQPSSAGCHQLIRDGATLFTGIDDILNELNYLDGLRPRAIETEGQGSLLEQLMPQLSAPEKQVVAAFAGGAMLGVDALAAATGLGAAEVSSALMMLELKKLVSKRADGSFEARSFAH